MQLISLVFEFVDGIILRINLFRQEAKIVHTIDLTRQVRSEAGPWIPSFRCVSGSGSDVLFLHELLRVKRLLISVLNPHWCKLFFVLATDESGISHICK